MSIKTVMTTRGLALDEDPDNAATHHFGLSEERWAALDGKAVWIVGAGTGYGKALAHVLSMAGMTVVLSGRRRENLEQVRDSLERNQSGRSRTLVVPCDATDSASVKAAMKVMEEAAVSLDALIYTAALPQAKKYGLLSFATDGEAFINDMWDTNVTGALRCASAAIPTMAARGAVKAVFLSSMAGWHDTPGFGPYNVSKCSLNGLSMSLAAETQEAYPEADVQINVLEPGEARSEMNQGNPTSPYVIAPMVLALLSSAAGGANGRYFQRNGNHLSFCCRDVYPQSVL